MNRALLARLTPKAQACGFCRDILSVAKSAPSAMIGGHPWTLAARAHIRAELKLRLADCPRTERTPWPEAAGTSTHGVP